MIARFTVEIELPDDTEWEFQNAAVDVCRTACFHICHDNLQKFPDANVAVHLAEIERPT